MSTLVKNMVEDSGTDEEIPLPNAPWHCKWRISVFLGGWNIGRCTNGELERTSSGQDGNPVQGAELVLRGRSALGCQKCLDR